MSNRSVMLGEEKLLQLCGAALDSSPADQTQIAISSSHNSLTRFAKSVIHQSVAEQNFDIGVKAAVGKRLGFASGNNLTEDGIRKTVETATRLAKAMPEDPEFDHLPYRSEHYFHPATYSEATDNFGPEDRADAIRVIVDRCRKDADAEASGSIKVSTVETAVANSFGIRTYAPLSSVSLIVLADSGQGTGWAEAHARSVADISWDMCAAEAADICSRNRKQSDIAPGDYPVVLSASAAGDLLSMLAWMGLDARSFQEGYSFLNGRLGKQIMSECISICDDGSDERGFARGFDGEGAAKQKVDLIAGGVATGMVYDSYTANKEHRETTGHGTGGARFYPWPQNLVVAPGDTTMDEMIASTDRGIYVTRFHYTNDIQSSETLATGMTRDGTFLIEGGRISRPLKNLRFTDKLIRAFSTVEAVGRDLQCSPGIVAPAIKLGSFHFTSATEF